MNKPSDKVDMSLDGLSLSEKISIYVGSLEVGDCKDVASDPTTNPVVACFCGLGSSHLTCVIRNLHSSKVVSEYGRC